MWLIKLLFFTFSLCGLVFLVGLHIKVGSILRENQEKKYIFRIEKGDSAQSIARRLKKEGIVFSSSLFNYGALVYRLDKKLQQGEFVLSKNMSTRDILNKFASGESRKYYITVKDCITSWELYKLLQAQDFLENDLKKKSLSEGIYAPDTYLVAFNTKFSEILTLMEKRQTNILDEEWENRGSDFSIPLSENKILTLASIIEKEAANRTEMPLISSVFWNRLLKGMRLQADPTVLYGIDRGNTSIRKKITRKDLNTQNEYNTYRKKGFPPSPICNPSRAAINSALNPAITDYLFFVLGHSGLHVFSQNYDQHKKQVLKLRLLSDQP